ncbi:hypothetical protein [Lamprocystis purpurea]|jgi:hypothetical protein|uniref:hypothetical protein n=1 Tax=Lamprocystis purpurea TaxID=61598 RepID=UPI0012FB65E8|nr:hypothetical protein [Lamprocystis purpurea]MBV5347409.1 hypothetical protein [bacterium]
MKHKPISSLFAFVAACSVAAAVNADSLAYVASLTLEDTAGNVKTQLERTTQGNCDRKLKAITRDANAQPGITRIVSSKCGEVTALIGFFERKSMGVPYITIGDNSVLILRGANENVCNNAALLVRQMGNNSACIFPVKVYE